MITTFGSVCSGIEAASVAWHPLGWRAEWLAEIEPFPSAVLAHHYPKTPNLGDMTTLPELVRCGAIPAPDVLVGGTPCQAFSIAGLRGGLSDKRGALTLSFVELANAIDSQRPGDECIVVWENVPGALSSKDNAFGCFLAGLAGEDDPLEPPGGRWADAGYVHGPQRSIAWRVLDAQYFGLAQRRRRVFVVASARAGFDPAAVLFEREGVRRDSAPSREAGKAVAALTANGVGTCGADDNQGQAGHLIPTTDICPTLRAGGNRTGGDRPPGTDVDTAESLQVICMAHGQGGAEVSVGRAPTLTCNHEAPIACCITGDVTQDPISSTDVSHSMGCGSSGGQASVAVCVTGDITHTLKAEGFDASEDGTGRGQPITPTGMAVRRLTPRECERLQGFPDIRKTFTMSVSFDGGAGECSGHQKSFVSAETKNLRSQSNALHAAESEFQSAARVAGLGSNAGRESSSKHVLVNVLIDSERQHLQLHNAGRLLLSVSTAELSDWCRLPIKSGDFVQLIARINTFADSTILHGVEGSPQSTACSTHRRNGSVFAQLCGHAISELVSDAVMFTNALRECLKSTISVVGQNSQSCDLTRETLSSCVAAVICSFIPEQIQSGNSFALNIETVQGYTLIPVRGKPAADGPRYKALGNSMAVPCMRWIGERIFLHDLGAL